MMAERHGNKGVGKWWRPNEKKKEGAYLREKNQKEKKNGKCHWAPVSEQTRTNKSVGGKK